LRQGFHIGARGDKIGGRTWTNAKHSGEPLQHLTVNIVARQGVRFIFSFREPMMPLCRNGLTGSKVVDL
jgi:hypothetical protein